MKTADGWQVPSGIAALALAVTALAQAPREVPVAEEPRHHFSFENDRLRAFRVEVAPRDKTLLHRHDRDYFYIAIGAADIVNAVLGRPEVSAHMADLQIGFAKGGFAHVAENKGDTAFRNFTIEFKRPQSKLTNRCARVDSTQPVNCTVAAEAPVTPEFETEECVVSLLQVPPGGRFALDNPQLARLLMPIGDVQASLLRDGAKGVPFQANKELWTEGSKQLTVVNAGKSTARLLSIALRATK